MNTTIFHLAQFNIIKLKDDLNSPIIKEFRDFLAPVNQLAEESPGFVWRLKDDEGENATHVDTPYEDKLIFVNLSTWTDYESLKSYSYNTVHSYFLKNRNKWGTKMQGHQAVLWWIPAGENPSVIQGKEKLDLLNNLGPSSTSFSMSQLYDQKGVKLK
ncbi:DUF3291 domain-containing protein [Aquimarina pacifica]|uniref:DUF3291 domain-containing protein n=1 Tax=Aquimarina pacifica TaxID=1296415 RepID=UPI0004729E0A|nr:DUF3291 domain-containing protein [Aquimarina pacifica]